VTISKYLTRWNLVAGVLAIAVIGWCLVFETVTRKFVATDAVCTSCHIPWEYSPSERLTATKAHPAHPGGGQAPCAGCHLPQGFWNAANAYTHFISLTDLFGHLRNVDEERKGAWTPARAKTALRVRDRMLEHDSSPCRSCHIESEIKPKRVRGVNAHKLALDDKKTCVECHYNLVHRSVDLKQGSNQTGPAK
jgi:nitrate/TMAO reductase-like tetraheme cytochrome c subunit